MFFVQTVRGNRPPPPEPVDDPTPPENVSYFAFLFFFAAV